MRVLKYWLILVSVLFSLSVTAAIDVPEQQAPWTQSQSYQLHQADSDPVTNKRPLTDIDVPRVISPRSVLFLADSQLESDFVLVFEFNPPDAFAGRFMVSSIDPVPWFIQTGNPVKPRVSGWKDGNTLYTARTIYYT